MRSEIVITHPCGRLQMQQALKLTWTMVFVASSLAPLKAQDLSPRAYVITAIHSNAVTLTYSYYSGSIQLNGAWADASAPATSTVPIFPYHHSFPPSPPPPHPTLALPSAITPS